MTKLLVALDESPISFRAAREAARLFPDAEMLVVNVTRSFVPWVTHVEFGAVYPTTPPELLAPAFDEDQLAARAEEAGLDSAEVLVLEGDPAGAICAAAEQHDVDVVVVGSHDKGVLRRLIDPSVAHAVVQGTFRPVLVVSGTAPDQ
jgi:nucleotide-binding universal stress UspA family protein